MAIIVKPHGDFAPNTTAESAKVNDQINTIYADHNGGLVDTNIAAAANIQQAKVHNLQSDLAAITANVNTLFNNFNVTLSTVSTDAGEPSASVVGEAQVYENIFVAANALGTDNYLYLSQDFLLNTVTGSTCQIRYYYGGQLFFNPVINNSTGVSQSNAPVHVDITLRARAATSVQWGIGRIFLQTTSDLFFMAGVGQNQFLNATGISVDSTADQVIAITAIWNQPGNTITGIGSSCWMVK